MYHCNKFGEPWYWFVLHHSLVAANCKHYDVDDLLSIHWWLQPVLVHWDGGGEVSISILLIAIKIIVSNWTCGFYAKCWLLVLLDDIRRQLRSNKLHGQKWSIHKRKCAFNKMEYLKLRNIHSFFVLEHFCENGWDILYYMICRTEYQFM